MINTLFIHNSDFIKTVFDVYRVYLSLIKIIIENSLKAVISYREITAFKFLKKTLFYYLYIFCMLKFKVGMIL